jgi:demethylphylloquinone reductase
VENVPAHGAMAAGVVIVGGGFGGLYTALALADQRNHPPILLIEPNERFLFLPLLYELLSGELRSWEIAPRYDALLAGRGVAWLQDRVERIDPASHRLHTAGGHTLPYARLVIATGAEPCTFGIPGAAEHIYGFRSLSDVERLQELLARLRQERRPLQRLAVVGGGPTGVELACKLADLAAGCAVIELIEQGAVLLPQARSFSREQAVLALQRKDVRIRTQTRVTAIASDHLDLQGPGHAGPPEGGERLSVEGVVWTAGLSYRPPAISPPPARDERGRLVCEPDLRLRGEEHVFVAGDLAHLDHDSVEAEGDRSLPANAQVAFQQAPVLAANLIRSLAGQPLEPFRWNDLGEMMSLGRGEACLCGSGLTLAGPAADRIRRLAYLTRLPGLPHQIKVAAGWLADWKP